MKNSIALLVLFSALLFTIPTGEALADGTETLGPPSITIEPGTDDVDQPMVSPTATLGRIAGQALSRVL